MRGITRRQALAAGIVAALPAAPSVGRAAEAPHPRAAKLLDALERFRREIPPPRGPAEMNGPTIKELEPYTTAYLGILGDRLGASTREECLVLLTYLRDANLKVRYIAQEALNTATKAYPDSRTSIEALIDPGSAEHRRMVFRFLEAIDKLPV